MDWNAKVEELISQLPNDRSELANQLANDVFFNRILDDDSRQALARAIADKFPTISDSHSKGTLLRLLGWSDSALACEIAMNDLENAASSAVRRAQYLYECLLIISRERTSLLSKGSIGARGIKKNLRLSFALLNNKPIIDGDCAEADDINNREFMDFLYALSQRKEC